MEKWRVFIAVMLGLLCLTGCRGEDATKEATPEATSIQPATAPPGEAPQVVEVTLSFVAPRFRPDPIVVQVGKPVQFKVRSADTRHTFVIEALGIDMEVPQKALDEVVLSPVVTPKEVGTFRVHCRIHHRLSMEATLRVTAAEDQ